MTRKDLVKLNVNRVGSIPVWAVDIELVIDDDEQSETLLAGLEECRD